MKTTCPICKHEFECSPLPGMRFATVQCPSCKHYYYAEAKDQEPKRCSVCDKPEGVVTIDFSGICLLCRLPNL